MEPYLIEYYNSLFLYIDVEKSVVDNLKLMYLEDYNKNQTNIFKIDVSSWTFINFFFARRVLF